MQLVRCGTSIFYSFSVDTFEEMKFFIMDIRNCHMGEIEMINIPRRGVADRTGIFESNSEKSKLVAKRTVILIF